MGAMLASPFTRAKTPHTVGAAKRTATRAGFNNTTYIHTSSFLILVSSFRRYAAKSALANATGKLWLLTLSEATVPGLVS